LSDIIVDTSPIQYLHQIGQLSLLARLAGSIIVPPQVVKELETGRDLGIDLPNIRTLNWVNVRNPQNKERPSKDPLKNDLGFVLSQGLTPFPHVIDSAGTIQP